MPLNQLGKKNRIWISGILQTRKNEEIGKYEDRGYKVKNLPSNDFYTYSKNKVKLHNRMVQEAWE